MFTWRIFMCCPL